MLISDWSSDVCSSDLGKFVAQFSLVHRFVFNKWYFDELYDLLFVKPAFWIGRLFWQRGDIGLIETGIPAMVGDLLSNERSEERRVGKECVGTCRSRWWPYH